MSKTLCKTCGKAPASTGKFGLVGSARKAEQCWDCFKKANRGRTKDMGKRRGGGWGKTTRVEKVADLGGVLGELQAALDELRGEEAALATSAQELLIRSRAHVDRLRRDIKKLRMLRAQTESRLREATAEARRQAKKAGVLGADVRKLVGDIPDQLDTQAVRAKRASGTFDK